MDFFLRMTFVLAKTTGILDHHYDCKKNQIVQSHMPSLFYGTVMKSIYIGTCIFLICVSYREFMECVSEDRVWQTVGLVVDLLFAVHVFILCLEMLCKRKQFFILFSVFLQYRRKFPHELCFYKSKMRTYFMVLMITISVFYKVPFAFHYSIERPNQCNPEAGFQWRSVSLVLLWCLTLSIECSWLGIFLSGDILMERVIIQAHEMSQEISLFQDSSLSSVSKNVWIKIINRSILQLFDQQRLITFIVQKLIENCVWTFMISLFNRSFQLICAMTYQIAMVQMPGIYLTKLINLAFIMALIFSLMQLFIIGDRMSKKYLLLQEIAYNVSLKLKHPRNEMELILQNSVNPKPN